jgi:hypothetical protein
VQVLGPMGYRHVCKMKNAIVDSLNHVCRVALDPLIKSRMDLTFALAKSGRERQTGNGSRTVLDALAKGKG